MRRVQLIPIGAARFISLPTITNTTMPVATQGLAYSLTFVATGGTTPYTWSITGTLDPGLTLNALTGVLSGTPATPATNALTITVTDNGGKQASKTLNLIVVASSSPAITTTSPLPTGTVGVSYSVTLVATAGTPPYIWSYTGALNAGLTLNTVGGVIFGTPTAAGTATLTMKVTDNSGNFSTSVLSLPVNAAVVTALTITTAAIPNGVVGVAYSFTLTGSGGVPPYTWNIAPQADQLPTGLSLSLAGVISGTPTLAGGPASGMDVVLSDASGGPFTIKILPMTINASVTVPGQPTGVTATAGIGQATVSYTPPASNGGAPITQYLLRNVVGGVPTGVGWTGFSTSITATGLTPGTPYSFVVQAQNSQGYGGISVVSNTVTPTSGVGAPGLVTNLQIMFQGMAAAGGGFSGGAPVPTSPNTQGIGWTQATQGTNPITQNRIYRNANGAGNVILATIPAGTSYTDTTATKCVATTALPHNTQGQAWAANGYLYQVSAIDSQGVEGPLSATQIFVYYKNGQRWGMGGDVNSGTISNYTDTTGIAGNPFGSTQVLLNTTTQWGDWLPYAGNNGTQWDIWCGYGSPAQVFAYLNMSLKPSVANQTWNAWGEYRTDTNTDPTGSTPGVSAIGNAAATYGPQAVANVWATYKLPLSLLMRTATSDYGGIVGGMFYKLGFADQLGAGSNHYWIDNVYFSAT